MRNGASANRSNVLVVASLTLSVISLFVAIGGAADAQNGKLPANSVGTKQLKTGAVQQTDVASEAIGPANIAKAAVTTQALAPSAVTGTAIAPNAVTGTAIATGAVSGGKLSDSAVTGAKIAPGAVGSTDLADQAVIAAKLGPKAVSTPALAIPELTVSASTLTTDADMGDCQGFEDPVAFTALRSNPASMFSPSKPTDLVAPVDGVYALTLGMTWSDSTGYVRGAFVSRARGSALDLVGLPAAEPGPDGYAQTMDGGDYELEAGDSLRVFPVACGVGMTPATAPDLTQIRAQLKWVGQPGS